MQATLYKNTSEIRFKPLFNPVACLGSNYAIAGRFRQGLGGVGVSSFQEGHFSAGLLQQEPTSRLVPLQELKGHPNAS